MVPSDRGGRRRALRDGYRASISFGRWRRHEELIVHDAIVVFEERDSVAPGESAVARAWVIAPDELPRFDAGRVLTLVEGERIIARARVLERLRDDTPSPLSDLGAAKTRALEAERR